MRVRAGSPCRCVGKAFLERAEGDRHQFRFIVAAEVGAEYEDLQPLTRRLMAQMAKDLGTELDWIAVDHFNTGHPHTHILLRGKDETGRDLVIARDYMAAGLRRRAEELVTLDLGPRTELEVAHRLRLEVEQERLTSLDRQLLRDQDGDGIVAATGSDAFRQSLRAGRLQKLARSDLAEGVGQGRWRLAPEMEATLRRMGERSDIIKILHRELAATGLSRNAGDGVIADFSTPPARPLIGRVVARGLAEEMRDRHYLILDGVDGRVHYLDIGHGGATPPLPEAAIVKVTARSVEPREADRTIAAVAAAHGGRYSLDIHLHHDPAANTAFVEPHIRRLEAIRRVTGGAERRPDGSWIIAADHLDRVAAFERLQSRQSPVRIETLSPWPLERLPEAEGATWLDRELTVRTPGAPSLGEFRGGFGRDVTAALERRRRWLVAQGLAREEGGATLYRADLIESLRRRDLTRAAQPLSRELRLPYAEARNGERLEGTLRRAVDLASGRFAVIERSRDFTLVPWRPILEPQIGKPVSGIVRAQGISWTIGRTISRGQGRGVG